MDFHHVSSSLISDMFFGQVKTVKIATRVIMIMIFSATFHSISVSLVEVTGENHRSAASQ
jgi:hypothetical protein